VKVYMELLADFHDARARADNARAAWESQLPTEGVRLSTHPDLRTAYDELVDATERESAARKALMDYRGE
jgi:hypothetical protein